LPKTDTNRNEYKSIQAGLNYAENTHAIFSQKISPAKITKGTYRNINGNNGLPALGIDKPPAEKAKLNPVVPVGSYPLITPRHPNNS